MKPFAPIVIFLLTTLCLTMFGNVRSALPVEEAQFLEELIVQAIPDGELPPSWSVDDISNACQWPGITCFDDTTDQYITSIEMDNFWIPGTIPASIGNLAYLESIEIASCGLIGTIPSTITQLSSLSNINFESNRLNGSLPAGFWQLPLTALNLDRNRFVDSLPEFDIASIGLIRLTLNSNFFFGSIPASISNLFALTQLGLELNNLNGSIPDELFQLPSIISIDISDNLFSGNLPSSASSPFLSIVDVSNNLLSGTIPDSISGLPSLFSFNFGFNNISGTLPETLADLPQLSLIGGRENFISGSLPSRLIQITNLTFIDLTNNNLTGSIPDAIGDLTQLSTLALARNRISGTIPTSIGSLRNLTVINLSSNNIEGTIPTEIGQLENLNSLYLDDNKLDGTIPSSIGNLKLLTSFVISSNNISGGIPPSMGNMTSLAYFLAARNNLTNDVPYTLADLSNLISLDLSRNQLQGPLPYAIAIIPTLRTLQINDNFLDCPLGSFSIAVLDICDATNNWMCGRRNDSIINNQIFTPKCTSYFPASCKLTACRLPNEPTPVVSDAITFNNPAMSGSSIRFDTKKPAATLTVRDNRLEKTSSLTFEALEFNENLMDSIADIGTRTSTVLNSLAVNQIVWNTTRTNIATPGNKVVPMVIHQANISRIVGTVQISFAYVPSNDKMYLYNYSAPMSSGSLKIGIEVKNWNLITRPTFSLPWAASLVFRISGLNEVIATEAPISSDTFPEINYIYPAKMRSSGMPASISAIPVGQSGTPGVLNKNVYLVLNSTSASRQQISPVSGNSITMAAYFVMPSYSNVTYSYDMILRLSPTPVPPPKPQLLGSNVGAAFLILILIIIVVVLIFSFIMYKKPAWRRKILPCLGRATDPVEFL